MIVSLVVAVAENGVIGRDAALPWRLPADLRRFRELTLGHHVVMGRRTHASIGRALDGRVNVVLTSKPETVAPGCRVAR
ncbi:MAG: dihydrofolate reductase, partial [Thermodesulfobacteriota bacterium]